MSEHMTPVMFVDPSGYEINWGTVCWVAAAIVVVALVVAVVILTGPAGLAAIGYAAQGITLVGMSTAATVATYAAAGAAGALTAAGIYAAMSSENMDEFNDFGPTALAMTVVGGTIGAVTGLASNIGANTYSNRSNQSVGTPNSFSYNTNTKSLMYHGNDGDFRWSVHFTDHGTPNVHGIPHFHFELPHSPNYNNLFDFIREFVNRK